MKTLLVGDTHLNSTTILKYVISVATEHEIERIIFLGDYVDQHYCADCSSLYFYELIHLLEFKHTMKEDFNVQVLYLVGNHELPYLINQPAHYSLTTSDFSEIADLLFQMDLQVAFQLDDFLVSHAGFLKGWELDDWHLKPFRQKDIEKIKILDQAGSARGGKGLGSPCWADFNEELTFYFNYKYLKQIVGHTPSRSISNEGTLICIDTFSLLPDKTPIGDGSLLIYDSGRVYKVNNLEWTTGENIEKIKKHFSRFIPQNDR